MINISEFHLGEPPVDNQSCAIEQDRGVVSKEHTGKQDGPGQAGQCY